MYVIFFLQDIQQRIVYNAFCLCKDNQFTLIELTALPAATSMSSPLPILVLKYSHMPNTAYQCSSERSSAFRFFGTSAGKETRTSSTPPRMTFCPTSGLSSFQETLYFVNCSHCLRF
jgi:hypothetical protein